MKKFIPISLLTALIVPFSDGASAIAIDRPIASDISYQLPPAKRIAQASSFYSAPMFTPDFSMQSVAQRSLEIELKRRRGQRSNDQGSSPIRNKNPTASNTTRSNSTSRSSLISFVPSEAVSEKVKASVTRKLKQGSPGNDVIIDQLFQGDVIGRFYGGLSQFGLKKNSVPDAIALFIASMYSVANDHYSTPSEITGTVAQFRRIFDGNPSQFGNNEAKQIFVETLNYQTIVMLKANVALHKTKDPVRLAIIQKNARSTAAKYGFDFDKLIITDNGFAKR